MPGSSRLLPKLVSGKPKYKISGTPRLWNAKRRIQENRGLFKEDLETFKNNPLSEEWRSRVSKDVEEFVDNNKLLPEEKLQLFRSPSRYFSRPQNVPPHLRSQVYFPEFSVTLRRTPHLGPRYAQFVVPLWFSKIDLKSYLKEVYNVDVLHIRSFVQQMPVENKDSGSPYTKGELYRPLSEKRMTAELVKPFVWPTEDKDIDLEKFEKDTYWKMVQGQHSEMRKQQDYFGMEVNEKHRKSISEQAKELLAGKTEWKPTWQSLPGDVRVLQGTVGVANSPPPNTVARRPTSASS